MPEIIDPNATTVGGYVPNMEFFNRELQKTYSIPGDTILSAPTPKQNEFNSFLSEKVSISVPNSVGKASAPDGSTNMRIEVPRYQLPSVVADFGGDAFIVNDSQLGGELSNPIKVADILANQKAFENLKKDETFANSFYAKNINYEGGKENWLIDKDTKSEQQKAPIYVPSKLGTFGDENKRKTFISELLTKEQEINANVANAFQYGGFVQRFGQGSTIDYNDAFKKSLEGTYDRVDTIQIADATTSKMTGIDLANTIAKQNNLNTDNMGLLDSIKEVKYGIGTETNTALVQDKQNTLWDRAQAKSDADLVGINKKWEDGDYLGSYLDSLGSSFNLTAGRVGAIQDDIVRTVAQTSKDESAITAFPKQVIGGVAGSAFNIGSNILSETSQAISGYISSGGQYGIGKNVVDNISSKGLVGAISDASKLTDSIVKKNTSYKGESANDTMSSLKNVALNVMDGNIDVVDEKAITQGIQKRYENVLEFAGVKDMFGVPSKDIAKNAADFENGALKFAIDLFATGGLGKATSATGLISKNRIASSVFAKTGFKGLGYASISTLSSSYTGMTGSERLKSAMTNYAASRTEMFIESRFIEPIATKALTAFTTRLGKNTLGGVMLNGAAKEVLGNSFAEYTGMLRAGVGVRFANGFADGLAEMTSGIVSDTIWNSIEKGEFQAPSSEDLGQNVAFGFLSGLMKIGGFNSVEGRQKLISDITQDSNKQYDYTSAREAMQGLKDTILPNIVNKAVALTINNEQGRITFPDKEVFNQYFDRAIQRFTEVNNIKGDALDKPINVKIKESIDTDMFLLLDSKIEKSKKQGGGSKVVLNELLSRVRGVDVLSPYKNFSKVITFEFESPDGTKTDVVAGVGVDSNGLPFLLTEEEIDKSNLERAKDVERASVMLQPFATSLAFKAVLDNRNTMFIVKDDTIYFEKDGAWYNNSTGEIVMGLDTTNQTNFDIMAEDTGMLPMIKTILSGVDYRYKGVMDYYGQYTNGDLAVNTLLSIAGLNEMDNYSPINISKEVVDRKKTELSRIEKVLQTAGTSDVEMSTYFRVYNLSSAFGLLETDNLKTKDFNRNVDTGRTKAILEYGKEVSRAMQSEIAKSEDWKDFYLSIEVLEADLAIYNGLNSRLPELSQGKNTITAEAKTADVTEPLKDIIPSEKTEGSTPKDTDVEGAANITQKSEPVTPTKEAVIPKATATTVSPNALETLETGSTVVPNIVSTSSEKAAQTINLLSQTMGKTTKGSALLAGILKDTDKNNNLLTFAANDEFAKILKDISNNINDTKDSLLQDNKVSAMSNMISEFLSYNNVITQQKSYANKLTVISSVISNMEGEQQDSPFGKIDVKYDELVNYVNNWISSSKDDAVILNKYYVYTSNINANIIKNSFSLPTYLAKHKEINTVEYIKDIISTDGAALNSFTVDTSNDFYDTYLSKNKDINKNFALGYISTLKAIVQNDGKQPNAVDINNMVILDTMLKNLQSTRAGLTLDGLTDADIDTESAKAVNEQDIKESMGELGIMFSKTGITPKSVKEAFKKYLQNIDSVKQSVLKQLSEQDKTAITFWKAEIENKPQTLSKLQGIFISAMDLVRGFSGGTVGFQAQDVILRTLLKQINPSIYTNATLNELAKTDDTKSDLLTTDDIIAQAVTSKIARLNNVNIMQDFVEATSILLDPNRNPFFYTNARKLITNNKSTEAKKTLLAEINENIINNKQGNTVKSLDVVTKAQWFVSLRGGLLSEVKKAQVETMDKTEDITTGFVVAYRNSKVSVGTKVVVDDKTLYKISPVVLLSTFNDLLENIKLSQRVSSNVQKEAKIVPVIKVAVSEAPKEAKQAVVTTVKPPQVSKVPATGFRLTIGGVAIPKKSILEAGNIPVEKAGLIDILNTGINNIASREEKTNAIISDQTLDFAMFMADPSLPIGNYKNDIAEVENDDSITAGMLQKAIVTLSKLPTKSERDTYNKSIGEGNIGMFKGADNANITDKQEFNKRIRDRIGKEIFGNNLEKWKSEIKRITPVGGATISAMKVTYADKKIWKEEFDKLKKEIEGKTNSVINPVTNVGASPAVNPATGKKMSKGGELKEIRDADIVRLGEQARQVFKGIEVGLHSNLIKKALIQSGRVSKASAVSMGTKILGFGGGPSSRLIDVDYFIRTLSTQASGSSVTSIVPIFERAIAEIKNPTIVNPQAVKLIPTQVTAPTAATPTPTTAPKPVAPIAKIDTVKPIGAEPGSVTPENVLAENIKRIDTLFNDSGLNKNEKLDVMKTAYSQDKNSELLLSYDGAIPEKETTSIRNNAEKIVDVETFIKVYPITKVNIEQVIKGVKIWLTAEQKEKAKKEVSKVSAIIRPAQPSVVGLMESTSGLPITKLTPIPLKVRDVSIDVRAGAVHWEKLSTAQMNDLYKILEPLKMDDLWLAGSEARSANIIVPKGKPATAAITNVKQALAVDTQNPIQTEKAVNYLYDLFIPLSIGNSAAEEKKELKRRETVKSITDNKQIYDINKLLIDINTATAEYAKLRDQIEAILLNVNGGLIAKSMQKITLFEKNTRNEIEEFKAAISLKLIDAIRRYNPGTPGDKNVPSISTYMANQVKYAVIDFINESMGNTSFSKQYTDTLRTVKTSFDEQEISFNIDNMDKEGSLEFDSVRDAIVAKGGDAYKTKESATKYIKEAQKSILSNTSVISLDKTVEGEDVNPGDVISSPGSDIGSRADERAATTGENIQNLLKIGGYKGSDKYSDLKTIKRDFNRGDTNALDSLIAGFTTSYSVKAVELGNANEIQQDTINLFKDVVGDDVFDIYKDMLTNKEVDIINSIGNDTATQVKQLGVSKVQVIEQREKLAKVLFPLIKYSINPEGSSGVFNEIGTETLKAELIPSGKDYRDLIVGAKTWVAGKQTGTSHPILELVNLLTSDKIEKTDYSLARLKELENAVQKKDKPAFRSQLETALEVDNKQFVTSPYRVLKDAYIGAFNGYVDNDKGDVNNNNLSIILALDEIIKKGYSVDTDKQGLTTVFQDNVKAVYEKYKSIKGFGVEATAADIKIDNSDTGQYNNFISEIKDAVEDNKDSIIQLLMQLNPNKFQLRATEIVPIFQEMSGQFNFANILENTSDDDIKDFKEGKSRGIGAGSDDSKTSEEDFDMEAFDASNPVSDEDGVKIDVPDEFQLSQSMRDEEEDAELLSRGDINKSNLNIVNDILNNNLVESAGFIGNELGIANTTPTQLTLLTKTFNTAPVGKSYKLEDKYDLDIIDTSSNTMLSNVVNAVVSDIIPIQGFATKYNLNNTNIISIEAVNNIWDIINYSGSKNDTSVNYVRRALIQTNPNFVRLTERLIKLGILRLDTERFAKLNTGTESIVPVNFKQYGTEIPVFPTMKGNNLVEVGDPMSIKPNYVVSKNFLREYLSPESFDNVVKILDLKYNTIINKSKVPVYELDIIQKFNELKNASNTNREETNRQVASQWLDSYLQRPIPTNQRKAIRTLQENIIGGRSSISFFGDARYKKLTKIKNSFQEFGGTRSLKNDIFKLSKNDNTKLENNINELNQVLLEADIDQQIAVLSFISDNKDLSSLLKAAQLADSTFNNKVKSLQILSLKDYRDGILGGYKSDTGRVRVNLFDEGNTLVHEIYGHALTSDYDIQRMLVTLGTSSGIKDSFTKPIIEAILKRGNGLDSGVNIILNYLYDIKQYADDAVARQTISTIKKVSISPNFINIASDELAVLYKTLSPMGKNIMAQEAVSHSKEADFLSSRFGNLNFNQEIKDLRVVKALFELPRNVAQNKAQPSSTAKKEPLLNVLSPEDQLNFNKIGTAIANLNDDVDSRGLIDSLKGRTDDAFFSELNKVLETSSLDLATKIGFLESVGFNPKFVDALAMFYAISPSYLESRIKAISIEETIDGADGLYEPDSNYIVIANKEGMDSTLVHEMSHSFIDQSIYTATLNKLTNTPLEFFELLNKKSFGSPQNYLKQVQDIYRLISTEDDELDAVLNRNTTGEKEGIVNKINDLIEVFDVMFGIKANPDRFISNIKKSKGLRISATPEDIYNNSVITARNLLEDIIPRLDEKSTSILATELFALTSQDLYDNEDYGELYNLLKYGDMGDGIYPDRSALRMSKPTLSFGRPGEYLSRGDVLASNKLLNLLSGKEDNREIKYSKTPTREPSTYIGKALFINNAISTGSNPKVIALLNKYNAYRINVKGKADAKLAALNVFARFVYSDINSKTEDKHTAVLNTWYTKATKDNKPNVVELITHLDYRRSLNPTMFDNMVRQFGFTSDMKRISIQDSGLEGEPKFTNIKLTLPAGYEAYTPEDMVSYKAKIDHEIVHILRGEEHIKEAREVLDKDFNKIIDLASKFEEAEFSGQMLTQDYLNVQTNNRGYNQIFDTEEDGMPSFKPINEANLILKNQYEALSSEQKNNMADEYLALQVELESRNGLAQDPKFTPELLKLLQVVLPNAQPTKEAKANLMDEAINQAAVEQAGSQQELYKALNIPSILPAKEGAIKQAFNFLLDVPAIAFQSMGQFLSGFKDNQGRSLNNIMAETALDKSMGLLKVSMDNLVSTIGINRNLNKQALDLFYVTGQRDPNGVAAPLGMTYDSLMGEFVPRFEVYTKAMSRTGFSEIDELKKGNKLERRYYIEGEYMYIPIILNNENDILLDPNYADLVKEPDKYEYVKVREELPKDFLEKTINKAKSRNDFQKVKELAQTMRDYVTASGIIAREKGVIAEQANSYSPIVKKVSNKDEQNIELSFLDKQDSTFDKPFIERYNEGIRDTDSTVMIRDVYANLNKKIIQNYTFNHLLKDHSILTGYKWKELKDNIALAKRNNDTSSIEYYSAIERLYNSKINIGKEEYRLSADLHSGMFNANIVSKPPVSGSTRLNTKVKNLLTSLSNYAETKRQQNIYVDTAFNAIGAFNTAVLGTPALAMENILQATLGFGTEMATGVLSDLSVGRTATLQALVDTIQYQTKQIISRTSQDADSLTLTDNIAMALGDTQANFRTPFQTVRTATLSNNRLNPVNAINRALTSKTYKLAFVPLIELQKQVNETMYRMSSMIVAKATISNMLINNKIDPKNFDPDIKEHKDIFNSVIASIQEGRLSSADSEGNASAWYRKSSSLGMARFVGYAFSSANATYIQGENILKVAALYTNKSFRNSLSETDKQVMTIAARRSAFRMVLLMSMLSFIAAMFLNRDNEEELLGNKSGLRGFQANSRALMAFLLNVKDGKANVKDLARMLPTGLSTPASVYSWTKYIQGGQRFEFKEALKGELESMAQIFGLPIANYNSVENTVGDFLGKIVIPQQRTINQVAGLTTENVVKPQKGGVTGFVQSILGADLSNLISKNTGAAVLSPVNRTIKTIGSDNKITETAVTQNINTKLIANFLPGGAEVIDTNQLKIAVAYAEQKIANDKNALTKKLDKRYQEGAINESEYNAQLKEGMDKINIIRDERNLDDINPGKFNINNMPVTNMTGGGDNIPAIDSGIPNDESSSSPDTGRENLKRLPIKETQAFDVAKQKPIPKIKVKRKATSTGANKAKSLSSKTLKRVSAGSTNIKAPKKIKTKVSVGRVKTTTSTTKPTAVKPVKMIKVNKR